jgi:hypothetical protein
MPCQHLLQMGMNTCLTAADWTRIGEHANFYDALLSITRWRSARIPGMESGMTSST